MEVKNVSNKVLALGDNEFESGVINVSGGATIAKGTVLKRNADGKFAPVVSTTPTPGTHGVPADGGGWATEPTDPVPGDLLIAVMPFDIKNEKAAAADMGFRALVGGRVRADMLRIAGNPLTPAQFDALRDYGIIAVKVTNVSELDNQ
jgi:hypothetical protein